MRETDAASVSGGGSSGGGMEGDVLVGEGVASVSPAVGFQLAGSVCDDKVGEETAWLNGSDTSNSSNGLNSEGGGDLAGGDLAGGDLAGGDLAGGEATGRGGVGQGGLPPRLPGRSSSSYTELDTMMEHIIPNLGHFPRSDASVAFALNELDTLLSDEEEDVETMSVDRRSLSGASAYLITDETATIENATPRAKGVGEEAFPQQTPRWLLSHPVDFTLEYPSIAIVTTAALPWLTGTAVNPALRAAYLWERGHDVTLLVPWVVESDQDKIFLNPEDRFRSEAEQLMAVKRHIGKRVPFEVRWGDDQGDRYGGDCDAGARESGGLPGHRLHVLFYAGKYSPALGSIIPTQDIQPLVPRSAACIVLEEPEHLTWYHSGRRWIRAFDRYVPVVGVMHTNYVDYARRMAGEAASITLKRLNKFLCRQHTHTCIKLSGAVQRLPREQVCFVHGVADGFLNVGRRGTDIEFSKGAYFLGKALWAKGFQELLDRMQEHVACCTEGADTAEDGSSAASPTRPPSSDLQHVDVFGHGHELEEIKAAAAARNLPIAFHGPKDHLSEEMVAYRVFVNPSTSDVVATTSAEALAMGKWLLVPRHPCNVFFESFRNCLIYNSAREFSEKLVHAATNNPHPLNAGEIGMLTWQNATDRFLFCCSDTNMERSKKLGLRRVASRTTWMGYNVGYGVYSVVRKAIDSINLFA